MRWLAVAVLAVSSGCVGAYDSSWHQRSASQHRVAGAMARPVETERQEEPVRPAGQRAPLRVRVHATAQYAAQTLDWKRQVEQIVEDADRVAGERTGVRIVIDESKLWERAVPEDDLGAALALLEQTDPGEGVEIVVGLVGGLPRLTDSYHQIGIAHSLGRHLVMRAAARAGEHDAVDARFDELDSDERAALRRRLKRHRAMACFLHELGHVLGAVHETDAHSVMHPQYSPDVKTFSAETSDVARIVLPGRLRPSAEADRAVTSELLAYLERDPGGWVPTERAALVERLKARAAAATPAARSARREPRTAPTAFGLPTLAPTAPVAPAVTRALSPEDRATLARALAEKRGGDAAKAWATATPLFAAYPDDYEVQDARCQIAMARGVAWDETQKECKRLLELTPGAAPR